MLNQLSTFLLCNSCSKQALVPDVYTHAVCLIHSLSGTLTSSAWNEGTVPLLGRTLQRTPADNFEIRAWLNGGSRIRIPNVLRFANARQSLGPCENVMTSYHGQFRSRLSRTLGGPSLTDDDLLLTNSAVSDRKLDCRWSRYIHGQPGVFFVNELNAHSFTTVTTKTGFCYRLFFELIFRFTAFFISMTILISIY